eukprot:2474909-Rhodomonas_salina.1
MAVMHVGGRVASRADRLRQRSLEAATRHDHLQQQFRRHRARSTAPLSPNPCMRVHTSAGLL